MSAPIALITAGSEIADQEIKNIAPIIAACQYGKLRQLYIRILLKIKKEQGFLYPIYRLGIHRKEYIALKKLSIALSKATTIALRQ